MIHITEHDKAEWSRFAQAAYAIGRNDVGHRFSVAAACTINGQSMPVDRFDYLQGQYRAWLCFNEFPDEIVNEPSISEQRAMGVHFGYEKL
jgi:hypothetical protein